MAAAKEEFFRIFEAALNGMIETRFMRDTAEVVKCLPNDCHVLCHTPFTNTIINYTLHSYR